MHKADLPPVHIGSVGDVHFDVVEVAGQWGNRIRSEAIYVFA